MMVEPVAELAAIGLTAFTTTRSAGDFALHSDEPSRQVWGRWERLHEFCRAPRLAVAHQVHGARILQHDASWTGFLRAADADGHLSTGAHVAMAVSLADCVPVFLGHRSGAAAVVHSGWRGTAADISGLAVDAFVASGVPASELVAHCGPAICGSCYVVGPDVYFQLTQNEVDVPTEVDLRALITASLTSRGVGQVSTSPWCTRCHNERFYSHRCGDAGRQVGVMVASAGAPSSFS